MFTHSKLSKVSAWRHFVSQMYMSNKPSFSVLAQHLKNRSLLRVSGADADAYLQGLITNDIRHLNEGALSMYAMFLNSKGRVLHDAIIYKTTAPRTFLIECDSSSLPSLKNHLSLYKVRRKINIDTLEDELSVWIVCNENIVHAPNEMLKDNNSDITALIKTEDAKDSIISVDPRIAHLGIRIIVPKESNVTDQLKKLPHVSVAQEDFYKTLRYKLGIGEGPLELPPENCFPLEANCDYMHGVSFHKGCYIGQELTARTHHTGVVRKRLMPLIFEEKLETCELDSQVLAVEGLGKPLGKLRGVHEHVGLGLLRIEEALKASALKVHDNILRTCRPCWWPNEAPKERPKTG